MNQQPPYQPQPSVTPPDQFNQPTQPYGQPYAPQPQPTAPYMGQPSPMPVMPAQPPRAHSLVGPLSIVIAIVVVLLAAGLLALVLFTMK